METIQERIEELKEQISTIETEINDFDLSEFASDEMYSDWLDEIYGKIDICGYSYQASYALREIDPIAYNVGFSDYCDTLDPSDFEEYKKLEEQLEELNSELEELEEELQELNSELDQYEA